MSRFDRVPDVPVSIGPCECPGTPHGDGDVVYLAPVLSAAGGMAAQGAISDAGGDGVKLQELLWRVFRDHGITGWNLVDENGPVPLTPENIDLALPFGKGGQAVGDKADDLYSADVVRPFLERVAALEKAAAEQQRAARSKPGPTASTPKGTSPTPISTQRPQRSSSTPASEAATPLE